VLAESFTQGSRLERRRPDPRPVERGPDGPYLTAGVVRRLDLRTDGGLVRQSGFRDVV